MLEGCRHLGSCGSKKVEESEDEDSNLQPQYKGSNSNSHQARRPQKLGLVMNPVESLSRFLILASLPGGVVFALVEGGALCR